MPAESQPSAPRQGRYRSARYVVPPLRKFGWTETRAGRWIDPVTRRSYTAMEAWGIIAEREDGADA